MSQKDREIKEARYLLWSQGILEWKLDITQKKIYDSLNGLEDKTLVLNCSRRLGKSFLLTIMAIEQCLKQPDSIVKFIQPKTNMIRKNIRPIMKKILKDCPPELMPVFSTKDNLYTFPNGSEIQLAGTDNGHAENIRGGDAHLCLVDEAGFCDDLNNIIEYILIPTTTLTEGKIILSSTTPPQADHEFLAIMEIAEAKGSLVRKTLYDAVADGKDLPPGKKARITDRFVQNVLSAYPLGEKAQAFRTEYLCERIFDSTSAVIPEFKEAEEFIVKPWPRPGYCDKYVGMDIGFDDLTFLVFGFWDFDHGVLVIEDEYSINGPKLTTPFLAENIDLKEQELWTNSITGEQENPYKRVSDNNKILLNDLMQHHGINFFATDKANKHASLNELRMMIQNHEIYIHPRCKQLISHLKHATWDKARKDYKRVINPPEIGGQHHYDGVDALVYLVRNLDKNRNPYPKGHRFRAFAEKGEYFISPNYKSQKDSGFDSLERGLLRTAKTSYKRKINK